MKEVCLVTGGTVIMGSHLVEALTAQGHSIRVHLYRELAK
jgi:nucleoside-diphosphate-sugar epimerase